MNRFSDSVSSTQVFYDIELKVQHLLLYSWYYGSQVFTSITTSSPQWNKQWVNNIKTTKQHPRRRHSICLVHFASAAYRFMLWNQVSILEFEKCRCELQCVAARARPLAVRVWFMVHISVTSTYVIWFLSICV
jgi:hypothetical protein